MSVAYSMADSLCIISLMLAPSLLGDGFLTQGQGRHNLL
jgi:hypothetical protein